MCGILIDADMTDMTDISAPASKMTIEEAMRHAGAPAEPGRAQNDALTPAAFEEWLKRDCFTDFLWINANGSARCTACESEIDAEVLISKKHNAVVTCPTCRKSVVVKQKRYGHSKLEVMFYATRWQKSAIERDALVMIGYYCGLDQRGPRPELEKKTIVPVLLDVFRYGKGAKRFQRPVWDYGGVPEGEAQWRDMREVRAIGTAYFNSRVSMEEYPGSYEDAIRGTPFEGAIQCVKAEMRRARQNKIVDRSEIVDAIARRPWIEYMIKAGFSSIALEAMGRTQIGLLNPRGKRMRDILKLSVDRYAEIRGKRMNLCADELEILQDLDRYGVRVRTEEVRELCRRLGWHSWKEVKRHYGIPDRALIRYILRLGVNDVMELLDYWECAVSAGIRMDAPDAMLPRDLHAAHDRATAAMNAQRYKGMYAENEKLDEQLRARLPNLEARYTFQFDGLILRPVHSRVELIDEGNKLEHCVATYFRSYATGMTVLCVLRREEAPDEPWRTVEISPRSGKVIQDRGYKNDRMNRPGDPPNLTKELKDRLKRFWEAFYARNGAGKRTAKAG